MDTLTLFLKNLNQRSLTPRWPLTPCLLRSHVWLYPRIIVSKSHDNTSMYVDTVINFAKYHIHTHTYIHTHTTYRMSDHIVSYWTQFRRDKNMILVSTWNLGQFRWNLYLKIILHVCDSYNYDYLPHITFHFYSVDFQLNTDFFSQSCIFYRKIT